MSAAAQLALPVTATLPLDPVALATIEPAIRRGAIYRDLDLDSWQIACIEQARRLVLAGTYPKAGR
jgi:hypothetical protein